MAHPYDKVLRKRLHQTHELGVVVAPAEGEGGRHRLQFRAYPRYRLYEELSGKDFAFLGAVMAVEDELGNPVDEEDIRHIAESIGKRQELYVSAANNLARVLANTGKTSPCRP